MTRNEHLTYCSVCTNRKFNHDFGFICQLTDKKADFNDYCDNFKLDYEQRTAKNKKYREEIDANIQERKTILGKIIQPKLQLDYLTTTNSAKHRPLVNTTKETVIMESKGKKALLLGAIILYPTLLVYSVYAQNLTLRGNEFFIVAGFLIEIVLIYMYRSNKEIFRLGPQGIIIDKKEFVPWYKINFIYLKRNKHEVGVDLSLVLKIDDAEDKEIRIEEADREVEELASLTYQYIKDWKRN